MTKALVDGVYAVEHSIKTAEQASSDMATSSASLMATLLEQHRAMGLPDGMGLKAIRHAVRAVTLAAELREELIRAHGALNVDLKTLGLAELLSKGSDPPAFDWRTYASGKTAPEQPA